jgi:glycosyltransferase involved in cell wall biosynthesis
MEAMASGKPVIATDIGGMPDMIDPGETGILVSPGNVGALRNALQLLLTNREMISRMGTASLARIEHLKGTPIAARIEQVYQAVLQERSARRR